MNPETIVLAITAVAQAVTEIAKLAQTSQGQAAIARSLEDQAEFRKNAQNLGKWFERLFTGQLR